MKTCKWPKTENCEDVKKSEICREDFRKVVALGKPGYTGFVANVEGGWDGNKTGASTRGCLLYVYLISAEELIDALGARFS